MIDDEFKTLKQGDKVVVYDSNEKKEKDGVIEAIGGYCVFAQTETEKGIYYKEEIMKKISIIVASIMLFGCAKGYDCECKILDHASGTVKTTNQNINDKKQSAIDKCNAGDEYSTSFSKDCAITNK